MLGGCVKEHDVLARATMRRITVNNVKRCKGCRDSGEIYKIPCPVCRTIDFEQVVFEGSMGGKTTLFMAVIYAVIQTVVDRMESS